MFKGGHIDFFFFFFLIIDKIPPLPLPSPQVSKKIIIVPLFSDVWFDTIFYQVFEYLLFVYLITNFGFLVGFRIGQQYPLPHTHAHTRGVLGVSFNCIRS